MSIAECQNLLSGKRKYLAGVVLLSFITIICAAFGITGNDNYELSRRAVLLRKIGDDLLRQSGDHQSEVLPVQKIAENEYQISFEKELTFRPDSLVSTTRRLLAKDPLSSDYVVSVLNCQDSSVAYGYAISNHQQDDIVACRGRVQPKGCYVINIKFKAAGINITRNGKLLGIMSFLAFVGLIFLKPFKPRKILSDDKNTGIFTFGSVLFKVQERQLIIHQKTIDLTGTETRLLLILASSPNQTIARSRLQKELWEDEGVIVGRSLDMFISKLRKKLETDPNIRITVIRGKGYKLEDKSVSTRP